jgi:hypothetical protein
MLQVIRSDVRQKELALNLQYCKLVLQSIGGLRFALLSKCSNILLQFDYVLVMLVKLNF